jgi:hypothetical protein
MPAEEVNRVCQSLKVVRPESLGGAVLVYARAFEAIEEVPVVFAVKDGTIALTNPLDGGRLAPGLETQEWNRFILKAGSVTLSNAPAARSYGCLIRSLENNQFPHYDCVGEGPSSVEQSQDLRWTVILSRLKLVLSVAGEILVLEPIG